MNLKVSDVRKFLSRDKRKGDRLVLPIKILYKLRAPEEWFGPLLIDDISGHGLKFNTDTKIDKDTILNLKIIFPDQTIKPIVLESEVCWCVKNKQGYSIGVKFHKMSYSKRKEYVEYIGEKILLEHLK